MTTKTTTLALAVSMIAVLLLVHPSPAAAQVATGPDNYVGVSFGAQPQSRTVDANATTTIFDEDAEFEAEHRISNGPFFDISAGHRVTPGLIVGFSLSFFNSDGTATGTGAIPDPAFVGRPTMIAVEGSDLKRSEQAFHLQAVWFHPLTQKIDVAVSVGPSLIHVSQDFVSGAFDEDTQQVSVVADSQGGIGVGFNVGADTTYMLNSRYGVGLLLRYSWASVGLDAADVTVGGFQAGVGLRVRF